jgi:hypothetical protein
MSRAFMEMGRDSAAKLTFAAPQGKMAGHTAVAVMQIARLAIQWFKNLGN